MKGINNKFLRVIFWIVIVFLFIIVIIQFVLIGLSTKTGNSFLAGNGSVGKVSINLLAGSIKISDVVLKQPDGYQNADLLSIGSLSARINLLPLLSNGIHFSHIKVADLKVDIQSIDQEMNFLKFAEELSSSSTSESKPDEENTSSTSMNVSLSSLKILNSSISYSETLNGTEKQLIKLSGLNLIIDKLKVSGADNLVEQITLSIGQTDLKILEESKETKLAVKDFVVQLSQIFSNTDQLRISKISVSEDSLNFDNQTEMDSTQLILPDFSLNISKLNRIGDDISIENVVTDSFSLTTHLPDNMNFNLFDILLNCNNIQISDEIDSPAEISLTGKINDPNLGDNLFGLFAQASIYSNKFPKINGAFKIIGLELEPIKSLIPPGTYQALGGDAFDLSAELSAADSLLDCSIRIDMIQGTVLGMTIGGTPEKPELDTSSVVFNVFSRFGGGIGSGFSKIGGTTFDAAKTGLTTALGLGKGAVNVVGTVGSGVFKTVKGAVTLDVDEFGDGLKTTTVGTVTEAGKTVLNSGENLLEGTGDTINSATGQTTADKWRDAKQIRWDKRWPETIKVFKN